MNLEESTSRSSWSAWLDCECNTTTQQTERKRFKLCVNKLRPRQYWKTCGTAPIAEYQTERCGPREDKCAGEYCLLICVNDV